MLAVEEIYISLRRSSRLIIFRFISKTHWQMFLLIYGCHGCAPRLEHMASAVQSSVNLDDTLQRIARKWKKKGERKKQRPDFWQGCSSSNLLSYSRLLTLFIEWLRLIVLIT